MLAGLSPGIISAMENERATLEDGKQKVDFVGTEFEAPLCKVF
jgi:hypothetical protein